MNEHFQPVALEHASRLINHGPTVLVTSADGERRNVMAAAWSMPVEFTPRPDFGRAPIGLRAEADGIVVLGAADPVALYAPGLEWEIQDDGIHASARAHIVGDRPYVIELRCGSDSLAPHPTAEPERRERTEQTWRGWLEGLRLPALARAEVGRSALTLRALCHEATG